MNAVSRREWLIPAGLILLTLVPAIAGAARVAELSSGPEVTEANARFVEAPVPVVVHIIGATLFCGLGAFQFVSGLRRRHPRWHRYAGRVLVPAGLAAALSGLWMTLFYPRPVGDGVSLTWLRLVFGSAMVVAIVLAFAAIRRRDIVRHRAWMIRGYAIGIAAGTQLFTHLPWVVFSAWPGEGGRFVAMGAGWVINVVVAEWIIRRPSVRRPVRVSLETR